VHRDIKFQNIVFGKKDDIRTLKLIDFGLAGSVHSKNSLSKAMGTAIYLAPEVISGEYDEKADIWSLGVLLFYLITGNPPFNGNTTKELYMDILQNSQRGSLIP
jgi:calcium-dependent protein kinase